MSFSSVILFGINLIGALSGCCCLLLLTCAQFLKSYIDLDNCELGSAQYRRLFPLACKTVNMLTIVSVVGYGLNQLFYVVDELFSIISNNCASPINLMMQTLSSIFYLTAKTAMYEVYLIQLHITLYASAHSYSMRFLITFGIIIAVYNAIVLLIGILATVRHDYLCMDGFRDWLYFSSAMLLVEDIACSIAFLFLFLIPFRNILKQKRLYFTTMKMNILIIISTLSTLLAIIFVVLFNIYVMFSINIIINSLCLTLMMLNFPNSMYYQRICVKYFPSETQEYMIDESQFCAIPTEDISATMVNNREIGDINIYS